MNRDSTSNHHTVSLWMTKPECSNRNYGNRRSGVMAAGDQGFGGGKGSSASRLFV